jgi:hypothetical protein
MFGRGASSVTFRRNLQARLVDSHEFPDNNVTPLHGEHRRDRSVSNLGGRWHKRPERSGSRYNFSARGRPHRGSIAALSLHRLMRALRLARGY